MKSNCISAKDKSRLIKAALSARARAYAPYSKFSVGSAILAADGRIFGGCNVENASYSLTICAERVALCKAVSEGARDIRAVAVAAAHPDGPVPPCGACRQALAEFGASVNILLVNANSPRDIEELTLGELLPRMFVMKQGARWLARGSRRP